MKKTIFSILLFFPFLLMGQSYIGEKYDDFFEKMTNKQSGYINEPVKCDENDGNYSITVEWTLQTTIYSFTPKDICIHIYQFIPIEDNQLRKEIHEELIGKYDNNYTKVENHWVEFKTNIKVKHTINRGDDEITIIMEKYE